MIKYLQAKKIIILRHGNIQGLSNYRVTFSNDILSTGNVGNSIEDYITVDTDNKINVLRYVATITENKKGSNNVATVEVIDRAIYDEYEIFNFKDNK